MAKKQLQGFIVSNKMTKTVVVLVAGTKENKKYKKRYNVHKKYKADAQENYNIGDKVLIEESRPISKDKKWKVIKKIAESPTVESIEPAKEIEELTEQEKTEGKPEEKTEEKTK
jgi:small subunit ribosomal protein S17